MSEKKLNEVTLKRGRGQMKFVKSDDLIAIRPAPQTRVEDALAVAGPNAAATTTATDMDLGGFTVIKVADHRKAEETLDTLRAHSMIEVGTHVFTTPGADVPFVPTGLITLRFAPLASDEKKQAVLDNMKLDVIEARRREKPDGTAVETYIVRVTPESPNPMKVAEALQQLPEVEVAEPDLATPGALKGFVVPGDTLLENQWHLRNTGVQFGTSLGLTAGADARVVAAWQRAESLGIRQCVVAVIDDGFDLSHADLAGNGKVVSPWDFTTRTNDPSPKRRNPNPQLADWHGTACAGVAVGNANGSGITGAAPNCRLMPVRWGPNLSDYQVEAWFDYVSEQGAWVVSCSWGAAADVYELSTVQYEAIERAATEGRNGLGCVIVFAAGNANHDINSADGRTIDGFAIHPDVIAVAASNSRDQKSNYSNFGKEISICAPSSGAGGRGILTSDVQGTYQFNGTTYEAGYEPGSFTRTFGGTSSATPLVAGICALLLSLRPDLTARDVRELLETTTRRIGNAADYDANGHSVFYGYGCVDADAAVGRLLETSDAGSE